MATGSLCPLPAVSLTTTVTVAAENAPQLNHICTIRISCDMCECVCVCVCVAVCGVSVCLCVVLEKEEHHPSSVQGW